MTTNTLHYNVEAQPDEVKQIITNGKLTVPMFVGQGMTRSCGSDCYGAYVVAKKTVGKKIVWGCAYANEVMHGDWTEGYMDCSIDIDHATPAFWITQSGFWKNRDGSRGRAKYYYCDEFGKKHNGMKCEYSFNGARGYRDPSF